MTNSKSTKRALLSSAFAIMLCAAMLIGTTFAWFTDTASTGVNKIVSGKLKVSLVDGNGEDLSGKSIRWTRKSAETGRQETIDENGLPLWEPGATFRTEDFYIRNDGNLALKYKILVNGFTGDTKLLDVLDFKILFTGSTVRGQSGSLILYSLDALTDYEGYLLPETKKNETVDPTYVRIKITATMKKEAGNEYQGLSLDGIGITVAATQYTDEYDSTGNQYDADAEYPETVGNAADLISALADGKDVLLSNDIALTAPLSINKDITVYGDGNSVISDQPVYVGSKNTVTFKNVNFANPDNSKSNASSVYATDLEGKVVFDGCTFSNPQWECLQITPKDGAEIIVTNCTFIVGDNGYHNGKAERMLHIQNTKATGDYMVTVTNNRFIGTDKVRNSVIDLDDIKAFENVTVGGNKFYTSDNNEVLTLDDGLIYINLNGKYDAASVATGTFAQFTQVPAAKLHH